MIFTSYYAKMKDFPSNYVPVSISRGIPKWYKGAVFAELAPSWDILKEYKTSTASDAEKEARYNERYQKEVLEKMTLVKLGEYCAQLVPKENQYPYVWAREDVHVVLLCYEKSEDFCHRKIVSDWLNKKGILCRELSNKDLEHSQECCNLEGNLEYSSEYCNLQSGLEHSKECCVLRNELKKYGCKESEEVQER